MRDAELSSRRRPFARVTASAVVVLALVLVGLLPLSGHAAAATTFSRNLFVSKGFVYQDPYYTACTAAAVMHMLNTIAYRGTGGYGFHWKPYTVKKSSNPDQLRDMTSILAFERRNDTLRSSSAGSDAHGWRNALNYYGWGSSAMTNASIRPYEDRAYSTYRSAMKAAVRAIARLGMPVGVLAWAGGHAQVLTGYVVTGADPKTSSDFSIQWLYLSDPLKSNAIVNRKTSYGAMKDGALKWRFQWYRETDSPYDDPYTGGWLRSSVKPTVGPSEWYHKWVLLLPVRRGLPPPAPAPTPTPTPTPAPTDPGSLAPDAAPAREAAPVDDAASPSLAPSASPSPSPSVTPSASAPPSPSAAPSPSESPAPTEQPTAPPTVPPTAPPTEPPTAPPTSAPSPSGDETTASPSASP